MKRVKFRVSGHFPENAWREWPEILHADVSWPPSELISSGSWSVDFCNFGTILTLWNGSNLGFPGISWRTHGVNGLKFCTLMYLDHIQKWLVLGHGLLIFVILALFWLSETGQIWGFRAFPGERMEEMAWNFACWCIFPDTLYADVNLVIFQYSSFNFTTRFMQAFFFYFIWYLIPYIMLACIQVYVTKYIHYSLPPLYTYMLSLLLSSPWLYFPCYLLPSNGSRR